MQLPKINLSFKILIAVIVVTLLILSGLMYFYKVHSKAKKESQNKNLQPIRVKLLNGCGFNGLARNTGNKLDKSIIEVVDLGNTKLPIFNKSVIVIKEYNKEDLERLKKYTGINRVVWATNKHAQAPFYIIIGKDYENYFK